MSDNWAICIGIDAYDNLQHLAYARRDAEALRDFFEHEAGFKKVYYFSDTSEPIVTDAGPPLRSQPTFGTLKNFLNRRFKTAFLKPSDNLWFFFAGHGRREHNRDYIMPMDADPGDVASTAFRISDLTETLRRCGAFNVIMMLDACRNDGARDGEGVGGEAQQGVITVSACSPGERSYEISEISHGAFTYTLLEALRLTGPSNCATVERLDQQLRARVPQLCAQYHKPRQTPYTSAEPLEKRHLILLPALASELDLLRLKRDALQAETESNFAHADQLWWRVIASDPRDEDARQGIRRCARPGQAQGASSRDIGLPHTPDRPDAAPWPTRRQTAVGVAAVVAVGLGTWLAGRRFDWPTKSASAPGKRDSVEFEFLMLDERGNAGPPRWSRVDLFVEPLGGSQRLEMLEIPNGQLTMGSPSNELMRRSNEEPMHLVQLGRFFLSRSSVTQGQWAAIAAPPTEKGGMDIPANPSLFRGDDLPVESVKWLWAVEFCERLARLTGRPYRLPTEAEWEYACRAHTAGPFHFGPTITTDVANYNGAGGAVRGTGLDSADYNDLAYPSGGYGAGPGGVFRDTTTASKSADGRSRFSPNQFGLLDMHGNVWEHCQDAWSDSYDAGSGDALPYGSVTSEFGVLRGGCWSHHAGICRSAYRDKMSRNVTGWPGRVGFRVACTF